MMTSKDAMSIFYLKQEAESIKNEIAYCKAYSIELNATDVLKAINYDGMPHSPNRSQSAPFEADIIRLVDNANELMKRRTVLLAKKLKEINSKREELNQKLKKLSLLQMLNCPQLKKQNMDSKFYQINRMEQGQYIFH